MRLLKCFSPLVKVEPCSVTVRARSYRSQRKNDEPWRLQVELSREKQSVLSQKCNCEGGAGLCNHVIGLMYLIAHYQLLDLQSVPPAMSKTSLPQTWHVPQRTVGIKPKEIDEVVLQQVKVPLSLPQPKKRIRRIDGVRSTLYNPIPDCFGSKDIISTFREHFKEHEDTQVNSILRPMEDLSLTSCKFGDVATGSVLSYQQKIKKTNNPKVHVKVDGPELPPNYSMPTIDSLYLFAPSAGEQNVLEGLCVSYNQSYLYETETREQCDTSKWFDLKAKQLSSSKFKDVCSRKKDFESLAERLLRKTKQTEAMLHGINTEEEAASAYADTRDCNVFPSGIVINPSCPYLATSPDRRVYDPSEADSWRLLEIKCPIKDSITDLNYLKCVNGIYRLKKTHSYYYQVMGQMLLSGAPWADFYVYCKQDYHLEHIEFDNEFCAEMKSKLDHFYFQYLLPHFVKT